MSRRQGSSLSLDVDRHVYDWALTELGPSLPLCHHTAAVCDLDLLMAHRDRPEWQDTRR